MRALIFALLFVCSYSNASIPPLQAGFKKLNKYIANGTLIGGTAQRELVLSGVRRTYSPKQKLERIVLDVEASRGSLQRFGYFQIQVDQKPNRIVIDLNGVAASQLSLETITGILKKSPFVTSAVLTMDPEDRSANITLSLKGTSTYKVEAFELPILKNLNKQTARLAIDISAQH